MGRMVDNFVALFKEAERGGFDKYPSSDVEKATKAVEKSYGEEPGVDASDEEKAKWYGTKHKILKNMGKKSSLTIQEVIKCQT